MHRQRVMPRAADQDAGSSVEPQVHQADPVDPVDPVWEFFTGDTSPWVSSGLMAWDGLAKANLPPTFRAL